MVRTIASLFDTSGFPARWHCGRWTAALGWVHVGSDLAVFTAYLTIPLALAFVLARRRDFPFPRTTALFAAFVLSCGVGHGLEAVIFWHPVYRLAGAVKLLTAAVSWATAVVVIRGLPGALRLPEIARSERRSRASEERLALAARAGEYGVWEWDIAGDAVHFSARYEELLGYAANEMPRGAEAWHLRLHPDDVLRAGEAVAAHLDGRAAYDVEYRMKTRAGDYRWFHSRGQAVRGGDGRPVRLVGSVSDVTARKSQEAVIAEQVRLAEFGRDIALILTEDVSARRRCSGRCAELTVDRLDGSLSRIWTL